MAQRVKESSDSYQEKLNSLHKILVLSMKLKQSDDVSLIKDINSEIEKFKNLYF